MSTKADQFGERVIATGRAYSAGKKPALLCWSSHVTDVRMKTPRDERPSGAVAEPMRAVQQPEAWYTGNTFANTAGGPFRGMWCSNGIEVQVPRAMSQCLVGRRVRMSKSLTPGEIFNNAVSLGRACMRTQSEG